MQRGPGSVDLARAGPACGHTPCLFSSDLRTGMALGCVQGEIVRLPEPKNSLPSGPIPDHLRDAFRNAVWSYAEWNPALAEPRVRMGDRTYALSTVCGLVDGFQDRLAEETFDRLMSYLRAIRYTLIRQKLVAENSYAAAGHCFLRLIEDRKRHFAAP